MAMPPNNPVATPNTPAQPSPDHSDLGVQPGQPLPPGHAIPPNLHHPKPKPKGKM